MNENHAKLLGTPEWAAHLHDDILPAVTQGAGLGDDLLEIGPGPGAATEWLRHRVRRLVAVELDPEAAAALRERFAGTNVEVVTGDAAKLPYPEESFSSVGTFTMLHHVPTRELQDSILAGSLRLLRPGGYLIGSDSLPSDGLHRFHEGDTYNPVDPAGLLTRLQTLGFAEITVTVSHTLMFRARKRPLRVAVVFPFVFREELLGDIQHRHVTRLQPFGRSRRTERVYLHVLRQRGLFPDHLAPAREPLFNSGHSSLLPDITTLSLKRPSSVPDGSNVTIAVPGTGTRCHHRGSRKAYATASAHTPWRQHPSHRVRGAGAADIPSRARRGGARFAIGFRCDGAENGGRGTRKQSVVRRKMVLGAALLG